MIVFTGTKWLAIPLLIGFVIGTLSHAHFGCGWFSEQDSIDRLNQYIENMENIEDNQELERVYRVFFREGNITVNEAIQQYKVYMETGGGYLAGLLLRDVCTGTK